jgi:hypothetical protein
MPVAKTLRVNTAFGESLGQTLLLAAHPDETHDANGDPLPNARTLVLALQGDRAVFREQLDLPLVRSFYSSSGVAYCGSVQRGTVHKWQAGRWSAEAFSSAPVDFVRYVFVVPGIVPDEDVVFIATPDRVFVRDGGRWTDHRAEYPLQMDGTRKDQVFVGSPELSMWDGGRLVALGSPKDDSINGLAVTADDRLVGGEKYVSISTPDGGWDRIDTPTTGIYAFARFRDEVYALSDKAGVVRVCPGPAVLVSPAIDPIGLAVVGDGLIAIGEDTVLAYDGTRWTTVSLPACEAGKLPP